MKTYIGIDLGGTNVRVAKVTEFGEVLSQVKGPSFGMEGPTKVMSNLKEMVREIPGWKDCSAIGVGVPGPVDKKSGSMVLSTNLKGFTGYPLADELSKEFGMPAFVDNDANVAGLAEALVGAGKDKSVVYYVTISTGIGGKTVSGKHGFGGEIANIIIDRDREKFNNLNAGAVENEASGTHITRKAKEVIQDKEILHAGNVFDLADAGDERAIKIVEEATKDLGQMFATIACVCDPDVFVIGGGMTNTPFVIATLDEPGIIGAAMLPMSEGI